ncbi:hypothetical protein, conserved [Angomonas deanei]|uniref:Surface antigen-like protein n=1 Tax=Angomonas deanei TaxID=59799 RepID=A0A7G2CE81_9TRYP|nr:hypothetical protein, conserved [Angomonas deanei]
MTASLKTCLLALCLLLASTARGQLECQYAVPGCALCSSASTCAQCAAGYYAPQLSESICQRIPDTCVAALPYSTDNTVICTRCISTFYLTIRSSCKMRPNSATVPLTVTAGAAAVMFLVAFAL